MHKISPLFLFQTRHHHVKTSILQIHNKTFKKVEWKAFQTARMENRFKTNRTKGKSICRTKIIENLMKSKRSSQNK